MNDNGFSMKQGLQWFVEGWKLFTQSPLLMIIGAVLWTLLEVVLAFIPVLGEVLDGLLFPVLYAGFLYGIREVDEQRKLEIKHFFRGFQDISKLKGLLLLGLLMVFFEATEAGLALILGPFAALVIAAPLGILVFSGLLYSVPLVIFTETKPVEAVKSSYNNCGQHISAMISVYLMILAFAVVLVVTFGVALLVILPVTFCALYRSYQAIYR
ncbi:MAG: hypothetical protein ACU83N_16705 [Gammaproteobacteria bacterium]